MSQRDVEAPAQRWRTADAILLAGGNVIAKWVLSDVLPVVAFAVSLAVGLDALASALTLPLAERPVMQ